MLTFGLIIIFVAFGIVFLSLLRPALAAGKIQGRRGAMDSGMYSRADEPILFWILYVAYSGCLIMCFGTAIWLILRLLHGS